MYLYKNNQTLVEHLIKFHNGKEIFEFGFHVDHMTAFKRKPQLVAEFNACKTEKGSLPVEMENEPNQDERSSEKSDETFANGVKSVDLADPENWCVNRISDTFCQNS